MRNSNIDISLITRIVLYACKMIKVKKGKILTLFNLSIKMYSTPEKKKKLFFFCTNHKLIKQNKQFVYRRRLSLCFFSLENFFFTYFALEINVYSFHCSAILLFFFFLLRPIQTYFY